MSGVPRARHGESASPVAKDVATLFGVFLVGGGVLGFVIPDLLGAHLDPLRDILHVAVGLASVILATTEHRLLVPFVRGFGLVCLTLAGLGPAVGEGDDGVLVLGGGAVYLGARDHLIHLILGTAYLLGGLSPAKRRPLAIEA